MEVVKRAEGDALEGLDVLGTREQVVVLNVVGALGKPPSVAIAIRGCDPDDATSASRSIKQFPFNCSSIATQLHNGTLGEGHFC